MGNSSLVLDKWRKYFSTADGDLFEVIEKAILIAASDCPFDFKMKRDQIAEMLFTCKVVKCDGRDKIELAVPNVDGCIDLNETKDDDEAGEFIDVEIDIDPEFIEDVLKIKEVIDNSVHKSDVLVFDSLSQLQQKLQKMPMTFVILKETQIGKSVNALQKHPSKEIRKLARTLIREWKLMVNAWLDAAKANGGAEVTPESVKISVAEEEKALSSPPLDEGGCCTAPSIELSQFESLNKDSTTPPKNLKAEQKRNQVSIWKTKTPPNAEAGASRRKVTDEIRAQQKSERGIIQKKPTTHQQEKFNYEDEPSLKLKFEIAKRKLHERYQEAENAKKRRTTQSLELHDLLKQRNEHTGPGNSCRRWA